MAYTKIFCIELKNALVYKADTVIGIFASILNLYMYICLWTALLGADNTRMIQEMTAYQAIGIFLSVCYDSDTAAQVGSRVMDGSISMDLIKPYSFAVGMFFSSLGRMAANLLKRGIPYLIATICFTGFYRYIKIAYIPIFIVSVAGTVFLYWIIFFIIGLLHFVLINARWFQKITRDVIKILGGSVVPLWYFPTGLGKIAFAMPFWLLFQFPQSILTGKITIHEILTNMCLLYGWGIIFAGLAAVFWTIAVKKLTIQGG